MDGLIICHVRCIVLLLYPAHERPVLFLELDGCVHGCHITTASSDRGSPNIVCLVINAWYTCSTSCDKRSELGISAQERPSGKKR